MEEEEEEVVLPLAPTVYRGLLRSRALPIDTGPVLNRMLRMVGQEVMGPPSVQKAEVLDRDLHYGLLGLPLPQLLSAGQTRQVQRVLYMLFATTRLVRPHHL